MTILASGNPKFFLIEMDPYKDYGLLNLAMENLVHRVMEKDHKNILKSLFENPDGYTYLPSEDLTVMTGKLECVKNVLQGQRGFMRWTVMNEKFVLDYDLELSQPFPPLETYVFVRCCKVWMVVDRPECADLRRAMAVISDATDRMNGK